MNLLFFSTILGIVIIISTAYLFYRWNWKALVVFIPVMAVPLISGGYDREIPSILTPVVLGALGGYVFRSGRSLKFFLLSSTLGLTLLFSGNFYYLRYHEKIDILEDSKKIMLALMKNYQVPDEKINAISVDYEKFMAIAGDLVPFSSFVYSLILASLAFMILRLFFSRFGAFVGGLEHFRLNDYVIFSLIAGWGIFLLTDKSRLMPLYLAGLNAALIASFFYLIQALGVIKFFIMKKGLPPVMIFVIFGILAFSGMEVMIFVLILLTGFGALDMWADFRKFSAKPAE